MLIIEHRINTSVALKEVAPERGVEVDVRYDNRTGDLCLNHDPGTGESLEEYLGKFRHAFIVFDIKEAGTEKRCVELAARYGIPPERYFLLDVEFPFLYAATRGTRNDGFKTSSIAVRYSEAEPIEMALAQKGFVDWAWIDTNTTFPIDASVVKKLSGFKTCLVGPDRWGRPEDTVPYLARIRDLGFKLDAIMVGKECIRLCQGF